MRFVKFIAALLVLYPLEACGDSSSNVLDRMLISADTSPVKVELIHSVLRDRHITLQIPRSALVFSSDYPVFEYDKWPSEMEVKDGLGIAFAVVAPDGEPIGEALHRISKENSSSLTKVLKGLRSRLIKAYVRILSGDKTSIQLHKFYVPHSPDVRAVESQTGDGLRSVELRTYKKLSDGSVDWNQPKSADGKITFFGDPQEDNFDLASCIQDPSGPTVLCHYYKSLNKRVELDVRFVDFRFHGGRQFLNEQMRIALIAYCRFDPACGWSPSK